ncbi:MAG: hypothetical protein ACFFKA_07430 [Candidatus Thorarchaeota archaeon]
MACGKTHRKRLEEIIREELANLDENFKEELVKKFSSQQSIKENLSRNLKIKRERNNG